MSFQSPEPRLAASANDSTPKRGFKGGVRRLVDLLKSIGRDLCSSDKSTRRMAFLFFVSLMAALVIAGVAFWQLKFRSHVEPLQATTYESRDAELATYIENNKVKPPKVMAQAKLGAYRVQLLRPPTQSKVNPMLNLAEIELTAECESAEVCKYLESHATEVSDQIANSLKPLTREELLSSRGKKQLRAGWVDQLNSWLPQGKVRDIWFTRLVIN